MAAQVGERCPKAIRVMAKCPDPHVAALAQQSTYPAASVVMIDGEVLQPSFIAPRFGSSTAGAPPCLFSQHRCIGFGRAAVVGGTLKAETALAMPPVVGRLAGEFLGTRFGQRVIPAAIEASFVGGCVPPGLRPFGDEEH